MIRVGEPIQYSDAYQVSYLATVVGEVLNNHTPLDALRRAYDDVRWWQRARTIARAVGECARFEVMP